MASLLPTTPVRYAEGEGFHLGDATNKESSFRKLGESLSKPVVTRETYAQYKKLGDADQGRKKRIAGWMIRAPITGGKRAKDSVEAGRLITLDIDNATPQFAEDLLAGKVFPGCTLIAHTTRSHTPENPRFRVILLADSPIQPDDYQRVVRIAALKIDPEMKTVDKVSARVAQLMYRPSCSADMEKHFIYYEQEGDFYDWEGEIAAWERETGSDSLNLSMLPKFYNDTDEELREKADQVEDPLTKKGPVGFFCRAYTISELVTGKDDEPPILDGFYEISQWGQNGTPERMTYLPGHSTDGVVLYNDDTLMYSHHGSDPAADRTLNAFDLVRLHKFGETDDNMDLPPNSRESYKKMVAFAKDQPAYKRQMGLDRYDMAAMLDDVDEDGDWVEEETAEDLLGFEHLMVEHRAEQEAEIDDLLGVPLASIVPTVDNPYKRMRAEKPPKDWIATELELDQNGAIKPTLTNMAVIIGNDSRLWRKIAQNEFSNQVVLLNDIKTRNKNIPAVTVRNRDHGDNWQDHNDITIRAILEGPAGPGLPGYGVQVTDRNLIGGVKLAARRNAYHPIRDMVAGWRNTGWDGSDRISTFLHRILGAEQDAYTAAAFRMMMIASVARVETPGCKFDYALILQGLTGIGKSTLVKILYGEDYFGELDVDLDDRKAVAEQISGKWALELPELGSLSRSDYNAAKMFMRRQHDDVRMVYARSTSEMPRQCVIWGTTNEDQYLKDPFGNRSYWIIKCGVESIDFRAVLNEREQLWAQAVYEHDMMREKQPHGDLPLTLTGEALNIAQALQESVRMKQAWEQWVDVIEEKMQEPTSRVLLLSEFTDDPDVTGLEEHDQDQVLRVCLTQAQAFDMLGFKRDALNQPDNDQWSKTKQGLLAKGWTQSQRRIAGGQPKRVIIPPGINDLTLRRGYMPVEAEPPEDSYDDLI